MPRRTAATAEPDPGRDTLDAPEEPTLEDYEIRRQALLAKLPPKEERPKTLVGKLALVTSLVGTIQKRGRNDYHGYNYATEADLVEAIRPLLAELGVWLHTTLSWDETRFAAGPAAQLGVPEDRLTVAPPRWVGHERIKINEHAEVASLTVLMVAFHFIDSESGQTTPVQIFPGYGDDTGDKGAYKALTGAEKYFLMKTFLVATGDDPEGDKRSDERSAARDAATTVNVGRGPAGSGAAAHGGRQKEASKPQIRALGEAIRAAGITTVLDAIEAVQKLTGKTVPVGEEQQPVDALTAFLPTLTGPEVSKALQDIKAGALTPSEDRDTSSQEPSDGAAAETPEQPAEASSDDQLEGYT